MQSLTLFRRLPELCLKFVKAKRAQLMEMRPAFVAHLTVLWEFGLLEQDHLLATLDSLDDG